MKTLKNADITAGIGLCVLSTAVFLSASRFKGMGASEYGPHLFPQFLAMSLFIASILLIVRALQGKSLNPQDRIDLRGMLRTGGAILMCIVYILAMQFIGFFVATALFLFGMMTYIKQKKIMIRIIASLSVAFIVMLLFENFLKIPLPSMDFSFSF